ADPALADRAIPLVKKPQHGACGLKPHHFAIWFHQQSWQMAAVDVAQTLRAIVILGEEERGVSVVGGIVIKKLVYRLQQLLRLVYRHGTLAPQICLQVRHEQRAGNSLACDIAQYQAETAIADMEKVVVVAAYLMRLNTGSGVI